MLNRKTSYQRFYSLTKHTYQDDDKILPEGFALDIENLEIFS